MMERLASQRPIRGRLRPGAICTYDANDKGVLAIHQHQSINIRKVTSTNEFVHCLFLQWFLARKNVIHLPIKSLDQARPLGAFREFGVTNHYSPALLHPLKKCPQPSHDSPAGNDVAKS